MDDAQVRACYEAARDEWRQARALIEAEGVIVHDAKGRPVPHPAIAVERSAGRDMRAWLTHMRDTGLPEDIGW